MNKRYFILFLGVLLLFNCKISSGQTTITFTNGTKIKARILDESSDSISFRMQELMDAPEIRVHKSEIEHIEKWNGERDYFHGSYKNLSEKDTTEIITGVESPDRFAEVEGIEITVQNLFTENHLILDFTHFRDASFIAVKGKINFLFEDSKKDFSVRSYPSSDKTIYSKFVFNESGKNKKYDLASELYISAMYVYQDDKIIRLELTEAQSILIREMFAGNDTK